MSEDAKDMQFDNMDKETWDRVDKDNAHKQVMRWRNDEVDRLDARIATLLAQHDDAVQAYNIEAEKRIILEKRVKELETPVYQRRGWEDATWVRDARNHITGLQAKLEEVTADMAADTKAQVLQGQVHALQARLEALLDMQWEEETL